MNDPTYLQLKPGDVPPHIEGPPFRAVLVIEGDVSPTWRDQVSGWLVKSGCRYMLAWGPRCGDWDTSVDEANLARFDFGEIPNDDFVMTTWHEKESLRETFWFAQMCAMHPTVELDRTCIVHIALEGRATELLDAYRAALEEE
ncbi:MAG: hypothetical protein ISS15_16800 [Alphaproteobacteria bacterium]|nr:hypothetical protein [Alphaproteobacteria bacterium]MBL6937854.1 hypothetical protein [Alphaproteobacteria bacterium]MBL7099320.1 hypothetical protein [Alphaproteobacteria bacterium]